MTGGPRNLWDPWMVELRNRLRRQGLFDVAAMLLILGTKHYYSIADAEGLRWILTPLAGIVRLLSGMDYTWVEQTGYANHAHGVVIAPACAGVNFLIICFAALFFSFLPRWHGHGGKSLWLVLSAAFAGLATLLANSLRIILSVYLYEAPIYGGRLTRTRIHQLAGMLLFVSLLVTIWLAADRLLQPGASGKRKEIRPDVPGMAGPQTSRLFLLAPFAWYALITIAVPWLNGALPRYGFAFIEHAIMVTMVCGGAFILINRVAARAKKTVDRSD